MKINKTLVKVVVEDDRGNWAVMGYIVDCNDLMITVDRFFRPGVKIVIKISAIQTIQTMDEQVILRNNYRERGC